MSEVRELANRCEGYMNAYLVNRITKQNYSFEEEEFNKKTSIQENGDYYYHEVGGNLDMTEEIPKNKEDVEINLAESKKTYGGEVSRGSELITQGHSLSMSQDMRFSKSQLRIAKMGTKQTPLLSGGERMDTEMKTLKTEGNDHEANENFQPKTTLNPNERTFQSKEDKKVQQQLERDENVDMDALRSERFLNSKDDYKGLVILQFAFVISLFIAYFVTDYVDNHSTLNKIKISLNHLKLSVEEMPNIRLVEAFTLEELAEGNPGAVYVYTGKSIEKVKKYINS